MNRCFADTYYFLALLNPHDEANEKAVEFNASSRRPRITILSKRVSTRFCDRRRDYHARGLISA